MFLNSEIVPIRTISPTLSWCFTPLLSVGTVFILFFLLDVSPETCGHLFCTSSCSPCRCLHPVPSAVAIQQGQKQKVEFYRRTTASPSPRLLPFWHTAHLLDMSSRPLYNSPLPTAGRFAVNWNAASNWNSDKKWSKWWWYALWRALLLSSLHLRGT